MKQSISNLLKSGLLLMGLYLISTSNINAQCEITQGMSTSNARITLTSDLGQSFTVCQTGVITNITINTMGISTAGDATLKIAAGDNTTIPDYTESVSIPLVDGDHVIDLSTPFPVTDGVQYAFSLVGIGTTNIAWRLNSDVYSGGNAFQSAFQATIIDMRFAITIVAPTSNMITKIEPIPTMPQWSLLIFGLVILNLSIFFVLHMEST